MLTVELAINGRPIHRLDIRNLGTLEDDGQTNPDTWRMRVSGEFFYRAHSHNLGNGICEIVDVKHFRSAGALVLLREVLEALT